ncbi:MAG: ABC transporter ATP-binding protein [Alphaproteobacteria bacterium]|nr:ABC transporter ATP-binding protein [Alphaproteobacteria bacterium]MCY4319389.1 ABC transporter ATP-binding protein [Alphaproteobacteria bacterium]
MHFERRLWRFTEGVRGRIFFSMAVGLLATTLGVARLALLGWLIGRIFAGATVSDLVWPSLGIAAVMVARGACEHWRTIVAHKTAALVQKRLRRMLFDHIASLGPSYAGRQRSGALTLSLVDGIEQLETYFGQYLPQLMVSFVTPALIFVFVAFIDLPVAAVLFAFALAALLLPAAWHSLDVASARQRQTAYANFAAEFLDSIQGLTTLKAFGQSAVRADLLAYKARELFRRTMWVLGTNVLSRGITDCMIAIGAAAALALGAARVSAGEMALASLLVILMMGVEVFRPMRDLRAVLHQGMVGLSAAKGIYAILDAEQDVTDGPENAEADRLEPAIAFEAVTFSYPGARGPAHKGLSFSVAPGERIGVVGQSGCGKTSIVRLLLRFFDPDSGRIMLGGIDLRDMSFAQIRRNISVVNQDTFLFHGTIDENIRMGHPDASREEVEKAARIANIEGFITSLPDGYDTLIGEKGIKLSGGQRQRVAIARAVLRDTPILVLDEALSAVDADNEAVIQEALDRLMRGRTVLVLAHRLSSVITCDRILAMEDGRVVESGPHSTLMAVPDGVYASLMHEQARESDEREEDDLLIDAAAPTTETPDATPGGAKQVPTEGVIKAEGLAWFQVVAALMRVILPWKARLGLTFLFGVLRVLAFIGVGAVSALIVFSLKTGEPYGHLLVWLWVLAPVAGIVHWLESWVAHDMAFRLLAEMRVDAFRKLDKLAPAYLVRRRSGDLMNLATHDIELIEYFFAHTVAPAFVAVLVPAIVILVLCWASPWIALALVPFLAAVGLSPFLMRGRVDRLGSRAREAAGELGAYAIDSVQGLGEIVSFQDERRRADGFDRLADRHIALRLPFFGEVTLQESLLEVLTGLGGLAVVMSGALLVQAGTVEAGLLPLLALLAMSAFLPVSEIAQIGRRLADTLGATRRYYALKNEPVPVVDGPGVAEGAGAQVGLSLEGISFAYPGQTRRALSELTVTIPAGKTVALVGASGAGKTTMAQLLMRFWDPDTGRIVLNGADLRDYRLDELRRGIALVSQDTYLFNDTLRANVTIARPNASETELAAALDHAALGPLISTLPEGLETVVGERGASLSGGQRQRVAIARAFLKDAPILILDEATSHLDALNERAVRHALDVLKADRTTVVIAHRLSTVRGADKIVVLDGGRLVEAGTHGELLAKRGLYAALVQRQLASAAAQ